MGTRVTKYNVGDAKKDDKDHISYLKQDIDYDAKHDGSDEQMTNDEEHITNLARDVKYDDSVAKMKGSVAKKKGSMAYMSASQERKDLNKMPGSYKKMGDAPTMMKGSFMSNHCRKNNSRGL